MAPSVTVADYGALAVCASAAALGGLVRSAAFNGGGGAAAEVARAQAAHYRAVIGASEGAGSALLSPMASAAAYATLTMDAVDARLLGALLDLRPGGAGWPADNSAADRVQRAAYAAALRRVPPALLPLDDAARFFGDVGVTLDGVRLRGGAVYMAGSGSKRQRVEDEMQREAAFIARRNARARGLGLRLGRSAAGSTDSDDDASSAGYSNGGEARADAHGGLGAHGDGGDGVDDAGAGAGELPRPDDAGDGDGESLSSTSSSSSSPSSSSSSSSSDDGFRRARRGRGRGRGHGRGRGRGRGRGGGDCAAGVQRAPGGSLAAARLAKANKRAALSAAANNTE